MNMRSYSCCTASGGKHREIIALSSLLKLISEENRLRILCILSEGEHCVCELMDHTHISQSLLSHHLKDLKNAGIVMDTKKGLYVHYHLTPKGKRLTDIFLSMMKKEAPI